MQPSSPTLSPASLPYSPTPSPTDSMCSSVRVRGRQNSVSDVVADENTSRNHFCPTDYYTFSGPSPRKYTEVLKNSLPEPMRPLFQPSTGPFVPEEDGRLIYDRSKFMLDEVSSVASRPSEVFCIWVVSRELKQSVAFVEWLHTGFGVLINESAAQPNFPFSEHEFLQAIFVAKWQLELFCLPKLWVSDSESDDVAEPEAMDVEETKGSRAPKRAFSPTLSELVGADCVAKRLRSGNTSPTNSAACSEADADAMSRSYSR